MAGKVNLYLPGDAELAQKAGEAYKKISGKAEIAASFRYAGEKDAVMAASQAAAAGSTSVIVATRDNFCEIKLLLLKVLSVRVLRSSTVITNLGIRLSRNSKEYKIQTAVPQGGKIFPSETGVDSAMSCSFRKGHIVLLPIGAEELGAALEAGALDIEEPEKSEKDILVERLKTAEKAGKTIGIANYGFSPALVKIIENVGIKKDVYKQADVKAEGEPSDKEYIANIAKAAKEKYACDYGVALSAVAEDGTVSVAVADGDAAKVEVIHPAEGDDDKEMAKAASIKVSEMIAEAVTGGINPPERPAGKNDLKPFIILTIIVAAALIACIVTGIIVYKKYIVNLPYNSAEETTASAVAFSEGVTEAETETEVTEDEDIGDEDGGVAGFEDTTYQNGAYPSYAQNGRYTTEATEAETDVEDVVTEVSATLAMSLGSVIGTDADETTEATEAATTAASTTKAATQGEFTFTVYGYGHGVGMSQRGAMALAKQGKTYKQILTYYYQGVTIATDKDTPKTITKGGVEMSLVAFLCKTVAKEIGPSSPSEAIKAQAVAAYTFAMCHSFDGQQAFNAGFAYEGTNVEKCIFEVLHISSEDEQPYADYMCTSSEKYINAVYCASVAGKTTSSESVWGAKRSYLAGGRTSPESVEKSTRTFTTDEMKSLIQSYAASTGRTADFSGSPSTWLKIISHDGSMSNSVGYVDTINVCGMTMSGNTFREKVMGRALKSHCFTISYTKYKYN